MTSTSTDVVVVGGGLVGTSLAYELRCRGVGTVLVDRHDDGRATDAGAGILSPETNPITDPRWFSFALAAAAHHRQLDERLRRGGIADTGYAPCELLSISLGGGDEEWFDATSAAALRRSPGTLVEVSPDDAVARFPPLGPVRRALRNPAAARLDGRTSTAALLRAATSRGLRHLATSVTSLELRRPNAVAVRSDQGRIPCGAVVIAGGAWSSALAEELGVDLAVSPMKGQIIHLELPGSRSDDWPIVQPLLNHYLVPWPGGRVACGGTFEADAGFDARTTASGLRELLRECLRIAPGLAPATFVRAAAGLRPVSADGMPLVGRLPGWENVWVATGHGTEGLLLGPYSAALAAIALVEGRTPHELQLFDPARPTASGDDLSS